MKKIILLFVVLTPFFINAQDACYNVYKNALQEYIKGRYTEAQQKFLVVAQTCGDYSDVWQKLKECNKKIADLQTKQTSEIQNLRGEIQTLKTEKGTLESERVKLTNDKSAALGQLKKSNETVEKIKQDIDNFRKDTASLKREIVNLKDTIMTLRDEVATNADAKNATLKALKETSDSIKAVEEEIVKLQTAINQLNQNYEKQVAQNDNRSLNKNPINDLQDAVENLNVTLKKVLTKISKIKSNNGNSGKLSSTNR